MGVTAVRVGDLLKSDAQTVVNTVNCVGVMGKGIAAVFKRRFPDMYEDYVRRCERSQVRLGAPYLWTGSRPWVLNFPTKDHWRSVSRLDDIEQGLEYLVENCDAWGIKSLAVPPLGCGFGGLDWTVVGPTLHRYLDRLTIPVVLYAPHGTPEPQLQLSFLGQGSMTGSAAYRPPVASSALAMVEILRRVTAKRFHPPVGRVKLQKLAYFATVAGIPTGLEFRRDSYGPFNDRVKPLLTQLANNGLVEEHRLGQMIATRVGRTFADAWAARCTEVEPWESAIERVTDLMMRLRSTDDMELAATAHFAWAELSACNGEAPSEQEVVDAVLQWKQRRRPAFAVERVAGAVRNLNWLGWIDAKPSPMAGLSDPLAM